MKADNQNHSSYSQTIFSQIGDWEVPQLQSAISSGADFQMTDERGNTLLHAAVEKGNVPVAQALIKNYGLDPFKENNDGITPRALAEGEEWRGVFKDAESPSKALGVGDTGSNRNVAP